MIRWLEVRQVLIIQKEQINTYGGLQGIRDSSGLESAINRPYNKFLYEYETDLMVLAAALAFGIAKNHPFLDGNKRCALAASEVFLQINGFLLNENDSLNTLTFQKLAASKITEDELIVFYRDNTEALPKAAES
jgi:death on curing protein